MQNDPELDGKYLGTISQDFAVVSDTLKEASYVIRKRGFSDHPIFPIGKNEGIPVGQLLVDKKELATSWYYNASFLDEFVQRALIEPDKVDAFKESFKDPDEFCCLFVIDGEFTRFVYIPYPID
jgi:hypothetical protein